MRLGLCLCLLIGLSVIGLAKAEDDKRIYISLGEASLKKALVAVPVPNITGATKDSSAVREIIDTFESDIQFSNLLKMLGRDSYLETSGGVQPGSFKFTDWAPLGVDFLIKTAVLIQGANLVLEVYLYDVYQAKLIHGKKYKAYISKARSTVHAAMDDIVESLTGKKGNFQTKIVMVCKEYKSRSSYISQIYLADSDGKNAMAITNDPYIKMFPNFSKDGRFITYTSFRPMGRGMKQDLMLFNLRSGGTRVLFSKAGLNTGSTSWHPNNRSLLMSVSYDGNRAIYGLKVTPDGMAAGPLEKVITSEAFDVEPDYSPDGSKIAFSSMRSGAAMIYVANADGSNPVRLTFAGRYNSAPIWSPGGDKILFQGQDKMIGFFDLFLMSPRGTNLERLTMNQGSNENASFSPDGRHIVYSSNETQKYQVYRMNTDGTDRKRISFVGTQECVDPSWSPHLNP